MPVLFGRHNLPPLVEIGLTDRPKIGGALAPPGTTGLLYYYYYLYVTLRVVLGFSDYTLIYISLSSLGSTCLVAPFFTTFMSESYLICTKYYYIPRVKDSTLKQLSKPLLR